MSFPLFIFILKIFSEISEIEFWVENRWNSGVANFKYESSSVSSFKVSITQFTSNFTQFKILLIKFYRLSIKSQISAGLHTSNQLFFKNTPVLCAEPLKKKKKLDPAIIKQREERRRKKLEKQIRRLEKNARQLKPIEELEVPLNLIDEKKWEFQLWSQNPIFVT